MNQILELLSARWLIHRDTALSYLPLFISFLNGGLDKISYFSDIDPDQLKRSKPRAISSPCECSTEYQLTDGNIPDNSIAVIPIFGAIIPGRSMQIVDAVRSAESNDKIISIAFLVNSPGGTVFYTDILADQIKSCSKPTVAVIMNMAASAAMWIISGMDYRIATSRMDWIGSVGAMTSITDMQVLLKEKLGISIIDIYAEKSTRKNEEIRAFHTDSADTGLIVDHLNFINEIFHKAIRDNLSIDPSSEVFTGAIFNAPDALKHNLINEINTLDYGLNYAYNQGLINKAKNQFNLIKKNNP